MGRKKKTDTDNKVNRAYVEREIADLQELSGAVYEAFALALRMVDPFNKRPDKDRDVAILMGLRFYIHDLLIRKRHALADSIADGDSKNDQPVKFPPASRWRPTA